MPQCKDTIVMDQKYVSFSLCKIFFHVSGFVQTICACTAHTHTHTHTVISIEKHCGLMNCYTKPQAKTQHRPAISDATDLYQRQTHSLTHTRWCHISYYNIYCTILLSNVFLILTKHVIGKVHIWLMCWDRSDFVTKFSNLWQENA